MVLDGKDQSFEDWLRSKISENHELSIRLPHESRLRARYESMRYAFDVALNICEKYETERKRQQNINIVYITDLKPNCHIFIDNIEYIVLNVIKYGMYSYELNLIDLNKNKRTLYTTGKYSFKTKA